MFKYLLTLLIALTVVSTVDAQRRTTISNRAKMPAFFEGFSVDAKLGTNMFFGDVMDGGRFRVGGELTARKSFAPFMDARVDLGGGILAGESSWASFKTMYFDFTAGVDYLFLNQIQGFSTNRLFDPYLSAGFGVLMFKPDNPFINGQSGSASSDLSDLAKNNPFANADAFTAAPMCYGQAGVKYFINKQWGARLEVKGVLPLGSNSDKLDGQDSRTMTSERIYLGEKNYDMFYTIMVGATYKFAEVNWRISSKYNRQVYMHNRKVYKRNAKRQRRR